MAFTLTATHPHASRPIPVLLALLLLGAGCSSIVKNDQRAIYATPKFGADRFVAVRDYNLHYVEEGDGPPLLLIPGAFTTYRVWNRVLPDLSRRNRVLAVDYLGVGDSDKPENGFRYSVEEQADVLAKMLGTLGLSRVNIIGASYGSAIGLNLAARYPELVEKLICIEGGALIIPEVLNYNKLGALLEWPILGDITWAFMKSRLFDGVTARSVMGGAWEYLTPGEKEEITEIISANIQTSSRSSWINIYRAITRRIDFTGAVRNARVPVLYLYGEDSKYRAVAEMNVAILREALPSLEILSLPDGIHDLHLQYPGRVARIALRFLGTEPRGNALAGDPSGAMPGPRSSLPTVIQ